MVTPQRHKISIMANNILWEFLFMLKIVKKLQILVLLHVVVDPGVAVVRDFEVRTYWVLLQNGYEFVCENWLSEGLVETHGLHLFLGV